MKKDLNWWCDRAWIMCGNCIAAAMTILIMINWQNWTTELKIVAAIAALVPIHVIEEWVFPGGFNFQYNTFFYRSKQPDRYPMCRLSDMITNFGGTIFFVLLTAVCLIKGEVPTGLLLGTAIFCALEVIIHTILGTLSYFKYKEKGKTTIYGPGSITAYLGFGVFGCILLYCLNGRVITGHDWLICAIQLFIMLFGCILIPENLIKKKDNRYFFKTNGYFDRFLK